MRMYADVQKGSGGCLTTTGTLLHRTFLKLKLAVESVIDLILVPNGVR